MFLQIPLKAFIAASFFFIASCGGQATGPDGGADASIGPEEGEELMGGETTVFNQTSDVFTLFATNLNFSQQARFKIGNSFFEQDWVTAPASTTARDGLGPHFNANSCSACHAKDGRGAPPVSQGKGIVIDEETMALLLRISLPGTDSKGGPKPHPVYGDQFQPRSILGVKPEGTPIVDYTTIDGAYADGESYQLLYPRYRFEDLQYGPLGSDIMISPRIAPHMIGMGLLEAIPEEDILALADPDDEDGDGISGRPNYVWSVKDEAKVLGRFGWKANQPSVEQQVAGAFLGDVGVTTSLFPDQPCGAAQTDCGDAINGGEPEVSDELLADVVFYSKTLAVPARRDWDDETVLRGKTLFADAQCASCHNPAFTTGTDPEITQISDQKIRPYTDLLLHDMGEGLKDGRPDFEASGREWRTPPLWGIGLIETVNRHTRYLHDGRARNLEEAVLWHGGEAQGARDKFRNMSKDDRDALIAFLKSL